MASSPISTSTIAPSSISNEPSLSSRVLVVINVATQVPLKLTDSCDFPWRKQFDVLLTGYDLYGFVNGNLPCQSLTFSDQSPNPDYSFWILQDFLMLGTLLASLSPEVHQIVATSKTSKDAWDRLAGRLLKPQGIRSILKYLNDVKSAADELHLLDHPVSEDDLTLFILNGLSTAFESISTAFHTRDSSISFEELHEKLKEHDNYIK
ncbi:uncharacterized protein LOC125423212 [Ziziphus jujuba]|uniref:Uncharacterized protein LOC125423212 n=1 Tax=Ziziphus jujuba TaxID=326968 RepID=A0ABM3IPM5_ZIZJJ|nr:uncharacterized protein LOC125423212 [Ziziphus jujuba]